MNRRVSIYKIGNQSTTTLADYRRADIFLPNEVLNVFLRISTRNFHCFVSEMFFFVSIIIQFHLADGKIEVFSKHDHTQFKLLASIDDPKYSQAYPLTYISFSSFNNTPTQYYFDCSTTPTFIDTQLATRYAPTGHPLLINDPPFSAPVDKRNCKISFYFSIFYFFSILIGYLKNQSSFIEIFGWNIVVT